MIKTHTIREKPFDQKYDFGTFNHSLETTVEHVVKYELGFGGSVTYVSKDLKTMKVVTDIWGTVDTMTYTGPKDEMKVLIQVGLLWMKNKAKVTPEELVELSDKVLGDLKGVPFYLATMFPFLVAQGVVNHIKKEVAA